MAEVVATVFAAGATASGPAAAGALGATAGAAAAGVSPLAAAGVAGAGLGLAAFLPSSSNALSILQGVTTGFSALASFGRGIAESRAKQLEAGDLENRAQQELFVNETDALKAKRALIDTVSKQAVGFAASGVDLSQGSVKVAQQKAADEAEADLDNSRLLANARANAYRMRARSAMSDSTLAYSAGIVGGIEKVGNFAGALAKRG